MSADIHLYHAYGIRNDLKDLLFFVDENSVVYPSGSNIVYHNCDTNAQKFIPVTDDGNSLTAISVARSQFVAYAEKADPYGAIIVYDLISFRKKRTMVTNEVNSNAYIGLDFAESGKHIVGLGGPPEYNIVYWWWEKTRLLGTAKVGHQVKYVKLNPRDANRIAVCGPRMVRVYKLDDYALTLEPKSSAKVNEFFDFICLAWVSDSRMLLGTSQGQIILWEEGNLVMDIMDPSTSLSLHSMKLGKKIESHIAIDNIAVYANGFVCTHGAGVLKCFEFIGTEYTFQKDLKIMIEDKTLEYGILDEQQILDISLSPNGDVIAVVTDRRQIFSAKLRELRKTKDEYYKMKPLFYLLHSSPVHDTDICVRKPLIATCAGDRTIRLWNFYDRTCEIWKKFPEEPHSIALHPNGLYLLAGFTDKLKMMHILNDDIKTVRDLAIRGCHEVKFSYGGHLFAAANGAIIQVYTTIQFENILNLKGHTSRVRSILWSQDDTRMYTSSQDGSLFEWDIHRGEIMHEIMLRGSIFTSLATAPDGETLFAVSADGHLKEIVNGHISRSLTCPNTTLTCVAMSRAGHCLIFGTTEGILKSMSYPLPSDDTDVVWLDTSAHQKDVTKAILSHDSQLLVSISSDGNVYVWKVLEGDLAQILRRDKPSPYSEEILIEKADLDQKIAKILDLTTKAEEIQLENEYQKRAKDSMYSEKIKDLTDSFTKEIELLKAKNEKQSQEKDQADQQHQHDMAIVVAKFNHDLFEQERITNQNLLLEYEKYSELIIEKEKQETDFKNRLQDVSASKEDAIERLTVHYETKTESLHQILDKTQKEFGDYMKEHDELRHMMEEDADMEIIDIRARYETAIFELKESNMRLKGENCVTKKKINNLLKDIDDHKAEVLKFQADLAKQLTITKGLEKEIESWKKELKEREENVQDKEKRIHELKKKNQELEKFKFVLDFKIKELRKQIEPKDDEISDQAKKIKTLKEGIEELETKVLELRREIHTLNTTLEFTRRDRETVGLKLREKVIFVRRFQGDMEIAFNQISNPKTLHDVFLEICAKYVRSTGKQAPTTTANDANAREMELTREVDDLRNALSATNTQKKRRIGVLSQKLWKTMQQNTSLIEEINAFRQEITGLRTRLQLLDTAVQGANPRRKDDYGKIQALLREVEVARIEELEKSGAIDLYRHELRRLHLIILMMRDVITNETTSGVQEVMAKFAEFQLPPLVGPSKIDVLAGLIADKVTHVVDDITSKPPGLPISKTHPMQEQKPLLDDRPNEEPVTKMLSFPKPEDRAVIPNKQLQFLKNLMQPPVAPSEGLKEVTKQEEPELVSPPVIMQQPIASSPVPEDLQEQEIASSTSESTNSP